MVRTRSALALCVAALLVASAAAAYPRPGRTQRISRGIEGEPQGESGRPDLSADGRLVVYESLAPNIVPGDGNEQWDVFVADRATGATRLVSAAADGSIGDSASRYPSISEDGRFVSFVSVSSNLVPGVVGQQIYLKDLETGAVEVISVSNAGAPGNAEALGSQVAAGGRYVAFESLASNLVGGDTNNAYDAFVRDRLTGTTQRVSVTSTGGQITGLAGGGPVVTPDGRYVAFFSWGSAVVPGDANNTQDIFVRDRVAGTTERVSLAADDAEANSLSYGHAISADGRYVAFQSLASNLVPNDFNGSADAFVRDRVAGTTERISLTSDGAEASAFLSSAISADGRYVSFHAADPRLYTGGIPGALNFFVYDRRTGVTEVASLTDVGEPQDLWSSFGTISADGRFAVFDSPSTNLDGPDENEFGDTFVRDRGPALGAGQLDVAASGDGLAVTGWATFSGGPVAAREDAPMDAPQAAAVGAELTRASLIHRPERGDLLARIEVNDLPGLREPAAVCAATLGACVGSAGGVPVILYGMELTVGTVRHELRAIRRQGASLPSAAGTFAHYRCDPGCVRVGDLAGGYGTGGNHITIAIPLSAVGAAEGTALGAIRAFAAVGEEATGPLSALDEVALGTATIPARSVRLGLSPMGTPEGEVAFEALATLQGGTFQGSLPAPGLGPHEVWARTCLGSECSTSRRPL